MGNTKRLYYTLFAGITPYFNEVEFQNLLKRFKHWGYRTMIKMDRH